MKMTKTEVRLQTIKQVAGLLAHCCSSKTIALLLNDLICCDADGGLSDVMVEVGETLFEELGAADPEACEIAHGI